MWPVRESVREGDIRFHNPRNKMGSRVVHNGPVMVVGEEGICISCVVYTCAVLLAPLQSHTDRHSADSLFSECIPNFAELT